MIVIGAGKDSVDAGTGAAGVGTGAVCAGTAVGANACCEYTWFGLLFCE